MSQIYWNASRNREFYSTQKFKIIYSMKVYPPSFYWIRIDNDCVTDWNYIANRHLYVVNGNVSLTWSTTLQYLLIVVLDLLTENRRKVRVNRKKNTQNAHKTPYFVQISFCDGELITKFFYLNNICFQLIIRYDVFG